MIKRWGFALATASFLFASQQAMALSVSANGGDDSFGAEASQTIFPGFRAGIGYLDTNDGGHNAKAYSGSLMFSPWLPGIDLAVGGRYQYQDTHYGNGGGLGLGGSAFVDTPIPLTSIGGYGFYTPEGLSNGDLDKSYEYGAQARVSLLSQTYVYGGYRYMRSDFEGEGSHTLDSGPVLGVSVGF
ncbi:YfaZ family outer membrane protein [Salinicola halophilus]|uniref:YfaZ family outer membrane protein n=1 Tax=Salinicola halophilus TaxID=184065 RepID=UPI000DA22582|nr:YfaZ family outer membrane protein [Salinicola halophilus]